jgi:hypothetical protein
MCDQPRQLVIVSASDGQTVRVIERSTVRNAANGSGCIHSQSEPTGDRLLTRGASQRPGRDRPQSHSHRHWLNEGCEVRLPAKDCEV